MASILTALTRKSYIPIGDLDNIFNKSNKFSIHGNKLHEGNIHSIYVKLTAEDYEKIYKYYNNDNILNNQEYIFYSNNKIGAICYSEAQKTICEKWEFLHSKVYNYDSVDIAYVVDQFQNRVYIPLNSINDIPMRLNSYGSWCRFDSKLLLFIGKRILYKNHNKDLEYISGKSRAKYNVPNLNLEYGKLVNIYNQLDVCEDNFIMFRTVNANPIIFNKYDIHTILCNQKLDHLLDIKQNLLEPII